MQVTLGVASWRWTHSVDQKVHLSKYTTEVKDINDSVKKLDDGPDMTYM